MSRVYDQWLDEPKDNSDAIAHEFQTRVDRYMETEWNPQDYEVFMEALFDADFGPWRNELSDAVAAQDSARIGWAILQITQEYCTAKAKAKARQDMEQS